MTGDLYTALSVSELGRTHPRSHKKREQLSMRTDILERRYNAEIIPGLTLESRRFGTREFAGGPQP